MIFARTLFFAVGATATQEAEIGPPTHQGDGQSRTLTGDAHPYEYTLRVGFSVDEYPPELYRAAVQLAEKSQEIGPIDLPFEITLAAPFRILVGPTVAATVAARVVLAASCGTSYTRAGSTVSFPTLAGVPLPVPRWATAAFIHDTATTGVWRDAAATAVGTIANSTTVPRPRSAVTIETVANSYVSFYYQ